MYHKICQNCWILFESKTDNYTKIWAKQKFCSNECRFLARKKTSPPKIKRPRLWKRGSSNPMWKWGKNKCIDCGIETTHHTKKEWVRCKECSLSYYKKENNHNWKWWITPKRQEREHVIWRKSVFEKDKYICAKCWQVWWKLEAHHICNFADFEELRLQIDNGITLCKEHHKLFHTVYWKKRNNKEQLNEFLANNE